MENSYVSDLLRTQVGGAWWGPGTVIYDVLGGPRLVSGQWVYARPWRAAKEVIGFALGVSGCRSLRMPHRGTGSGGRSEQVDQRWFAFQNKACRARFCLVTI